MRAYGSSKAAKKEFACVPAGSYKFITLVQARQVGSANNKIFFPQAQIALWDFGRLSTELSKHIWHLKDAKIGFSLTWKILKQAAPFNPASNRCDLCLWEKYFIICRADLASLNKRNEHVTSCRHARKFLLSSFRTPVGTQ